jgi:hypothetical protein
LDYDFVFKDEEDLIVAHKAYPCALQSVFPIILSMAGKQIKTVNHNAGDRGIRFLISNNLWFISINYFKGVLNVETTYTYYCCSCEVFLSTADCTGCGLSNSVIDVLRDCGDSLCFDSSIRNILTKAFM